MVLIKDGRIRVLLANFTAQPRQVAVTGLEQPVRLRRLDDANVETAMREPERVREQTGEKVTRSDGGLMLELPPFAIVRLDAETDDEF